MTRSRREPVRESAASTTAAGRIGRLRQGVVVPTWNHLWFVANLWVYTLLLLGTLAVIGRSKPAVQRTFDRLHSGAGILIFPLAWLLVTRLLLFPDERETNGLIDDPLGHAVFLSTSCSASRWADRGRC